jgi:hypothetical protein
MRPEYGVESFGDGEGQEEIGNGQEAVELFFNRSRVLSPPHFGQWRLLHEWQA